MIPTKALKNLRYAIRDGHFPSPMETFAWVDERPWWVRLFRPYEAPLTKKFARAENRARLDEQELRREVRAALLMLIDEVEARREQG